MRLLRSNPVLALLVLAACGLDEDDQAFSLQLRFTDVSGTPVAGLQISAHVPLEWPGQEQLRVSPKRAATAIEFQLPQLCQVQLELFHVDGTPLRQLVAGQLPAGQYRVVFDGRDDADHQLAGTVPFAVRLRWHDVDGGELLFQDETACVLYTGLDFARRLPLGTTDSRGILWVSEQRYFPFLYSLPELMARDAEGNELGPIELAEEVQIAAHDPTSDETIYYSFGLRVGFNLRNLIWDPAPTAAADRASTDARTASGAAKVPVDPPLEFRLEVCAPNPFN